VTRGATFGEVLIATPEDHTKRRSVRGGVVAVASQGVRSLVRIGLMMVMARLLTPEDFGLQGMVVAVAGFFGLFKEAGLSAVTVQRETITHEQVSTLFWINAAVGTALMVALAGSAPAIAAFYHDPRLKPIALVASVAFLFNGLSVQHYALLQRRMRFVALAVIETVALVVSSVIGLVMGLLGFGYWALVATSIVLPLIAMVGCWIAMPWVPGLPRRSAGTRSMLSMGSVLTLNSLVVYVAYNTEKMLLGRFWGAEALGIYGRAYQLMNLPTDLLVSAIAGVAFPSLARLQSNPQRLGRAFLRGYVVVLSLTIPTTVACFLYASEIVEVMLGAKWVATVPIFRLMTPAIIAFALVNPFAWFLISSGRARRSLYIALLIAPLVVMGTVIGVRFGPEGVALGFSAMMTVLVVPVVLWSRAGTSISGRDVWDAVRGPLAAGVVATVAGYGIGHVLDNAFPALLRAMVGTVIVYGVFFVTLLFPLRHFDTFVDLLREIRPTSS